MHNILCTTSSFGECAPNTIDFLETKGFQPVLNPFGRKLSEGELIGLLDRYKPVGILAGTEPITRSVLEKTKNYLKVISRVGVGWDNVDRNCAEEFNIQVFRTEGVLNQAVAELTLGYILSALRAIPIQYKQMCEGVWKKRMGRLLQDKTVGIIGFGAIGQCVGQLVKAFGARVIYNDPVQFDVIWAKPCSLDELLLNAHIITLHASGSDQILGEKQLNSFCKEGVIVVNTSRGSLIHEESLYKALISGHVAYACLDVFDQEPYSGPLARLENVILTPHIGSYALEARIRMEELAVENLLKGLKGI